MGTLTTAEHRQTYRDDGVVLIRGLFDEWVEPMRQAAERSLTAPTEQTREYETNEGGRFHAGVFRWLHDEAVASFVFDSVAARVAGELMGAETVSFFFDHLLIKEPGTVNPTPWHQDLPFWPVLGDHICSLWLALDVVDVDSGGVQYVAGSHRETQWYQAQSFGGSAKYIDGELAPAPDPARDMPEARIVAFDLEPGDVVAHHVMTLHGAAGNARSDRRRRGLSTRWCGDDARFDPRPKTIPLPFEPTIEPGAAMRSEQFPVVWPRPAPATRS